MKSLLQSAFPALILGMFMAPAHAQVGAGNYDLSDYTLESTHGIWQVLCTAPGSGSRHNDLRDCAVEDDQGFVMFVYPSGYYALTLRDPVDGDRLFGQDMTEGGNEAVLTYYSPAFTAEMIGDLGVDQGGEVRMLNPEGFAEAEARALTLMRNAAP